MGYSTDLNGVLKFNRQLTIDEKDFLYKLANTRRMKRNIEGYGIEGEFYVGGEGIYKPSDPQGNTIISQNMPPSTQPGLWCQWTPTADGTGLEWDGGEKFYNYVEWLEYIIDAVLPYIAKDEPLVLNGEVEWSGEDRDDMGKITVEDNVVTIKEGKVVYE